MRSARSLLGAVLGVALALVLAGAALGGCFRDRAPDARPAGPAGKPPAAAVVADELAFIPADAEIVMGIDPQQVLASPVWRQYEPQIMAAIGDRLQALRTACGYDPLAALRGVTAGRRSTPGTPDDFVIVLRGLDRERTLACIGRALGQQKVVIEGGIVTVPSSERDGPAAVMAFADATTLVMAPSRPKLDAALASGAPLRQSRAFAELWSLVDANQTLWLIANGASSAFDTLTSMGLRPRAALGSLSVASGFALSGRLRFGTPEEAAQLATAAQGQLGGLQGMVDKIEVSATGVDMTVSLSMTMAQVDSIARMMLGMWGGSLGTPNPLGGP